MKSIKYSVLFLIVFLIDINFVELISIKGVTPNLVLIFIIFVGLRENQSTATVVAFGSGLFQDLFSFGLLGLSSLSNAIAGFLTSYFQRFFLRTRGISSLLYLTIISLVIALIHDRMYQFVFLLGTDQKFFRSIFWYSLPKAVYTTAITLIINFIFHRIIWQQSEI